MTNIVSDYEIPLPNEKDLTTYYAYASVRNAKAIIANVLNSYGVPIDAGIGPDVHELRNPELIINAFLPCSTINVTTTIPTALSS